jgi:transcriptional regulator with XRE-family HTH domain
MLGYRQSDVAELSGVSREHLSRLEAGICAPTRRTVRDLAQALGCEPAEIFPENETSRAQEPGSPNTRPVESAAHGP